MSTTVRGALPDRLVENQWLIAALIFFILSMIMGAAGRAIFSFFWVLFAGFAIICLTQAFPDTWNYMLWLIGIYATAFFGWLMIGVWSQAPTWGALSIAIGLFLEACSYGISAYLILHIKEARDALAGIEAAFRFDSSSGRYVPLGIWSLVVFLFFVTANFNVWGWYLWASGRATLALYFGTDVVLFSLALYILWFPQTQLEYEQPLGLTQRRPTAASAVGAAGEGGVPASASARFLQRMRGFFQRLLKPIRALRPRREDGALGPTSSARTASLREDDLPVCPICEGALIIEYRSCPACGTERKFSWCPRSEAYIVRCPHCGALTAYGESECRVCSKPIGARVPCNCGNAAMIGDWRRGATPEAAKGRRASRTAEPEPAS